MIAKILVTGGAGFIGSEIVKQLSAHDEYEIRVLDALTKQIHGNNPEKSYLFQSIKIVVISSVETCVISQQSRKPLKG